MVLMVMLQRLECCFFDPNSIRPKRVVDVTHPIGYHVIERRSGVMQFAGVAYPGDVPIVDHTLMKGEPQVSQANKLVPIWMKKRRRGGEK